MKLKSLENKDYLKFALWTSRIIGLFYVVLTIFQIIFVCVDIEPGMKKAEFTINIVGYIAEIFIGFVFYALSYAFAALLDIIEELENTI